MKVKDYRLSEIRDICKRHKNEGKLFCESETCPLYGFCQSDLVSEYPCHFEIEEKEGLYQKAFELLLEDVYNTRLQADTISCSSCPFMEEIFDECQNQGLYEDCKKRWREYYLRKAEDGE